MFYALTSVVNTIKDAWRSIFGFGKSLDDTGKYTEEAANNLKSITARLSEATTKLRLFVESIGPSVQGILRGIFSVLKVITKSIGALWTGLKPLLGLFEDGSKGILST